MRKKRATPIFFSPLSISTALTLVELGANGKTKTEMQNLLQPNGFSTDRVLDATRAITRRWQSADSSVNVDIANSLWLDQKYTLKPAFTQMAKQKFDAQTATLDFNSAGAAPQINSWISGKTHDRIKDMIAPEALQGQMLVVANAVYFKGKWQLPFEKANTQDGDFHLASGKIVRVPMMSLSDEHTFSYLKTGDGALVSLPYGKGNLSLILLLPDKGVTLSQIVSRLDSAQWDAWMQAMKIKDGTVVIPRFTLQSDTNLNETLQSLGIKTAFTSATDFSPMTTTRSVFISEVKHKA